MSKTLRFLTALVFILLFWLISLWWTRPDIETRLAEAAQEALLVKATDGATRFKNVAISASGQELRLKGSVKSEADKMEAEKTLRNDLKLEVRPWPIIETGHGNALNPVSNVVNQLEVVTAAGQPVLPGWAAIFAQGGKVILKGAFPDDAARNSLTEAVKAKFPGAEASATRSGIDPAAKAKGELKTTIDGIPAAPAAEELQQGWFAIAVLGRNWQTFSSKESAVDQTTRATSADIPAVLVDAERFALELGSRPVAQAALTLKDNSVSLFGSVPDAVARTLVEEAVKKAYPNAALNNTIKVTANHRPLESLGESATNLPPMPAPGAPPVVGIAALGSAWKHVPVTEAAADNLAATAAPLWTPELPEATGTALLQTVISQLHPLKQPFVVLGLTDKKAILAGNVSDEAAKTALTEAAKKMYPAHEIENNAVIAPRLEKVTTPETTHTTFPAAPAAGTNPWLAVAQLGSSWNSGPVDSSRLSSPFSAVGGMVRPPLNIGIVATAVEPILPILKAAADLVKPPAPPPPTAPPATPGTSPAPTTSSPNSAPTTIPAPPGPVVVPPPANKPETPTKPITPGDAKPVSTPPAAPVKPETNPEKKPANKPADKIPAAPKPAGTP